MDSRDPLWFNQASKARQMHPELKDVFLPPRALDCYFQSESESPCPLVCFFLSGLPDVGITLYRITPPCDWLRQCLPFSSTPPPEAGLAGDIKYKQDLSGLTVRAAN